VRAWVRDAGPYWAIVLHGFTRRGGKLGELSENLAQHGISTIRPDLGSLNWFRSVNSDHYLDRVAVRLRELTPPGTVIVGHSAGAAAAAYLAPRLNDCAGIVMVDGVENPTHHIEKNWSAIEGLPLVAICAPPNPCNRHGLLARQLHEWNFTGVGGVVQGAGHGDVEDGNPVVYRLVCGSSSSAATKELVRNLVVWSVCDLLRVPADMTNPWLNAHVHRWGDGE